MKDNNLEPLPVNADTTNIIDPLKDQRPDEPVTLFPPDKATQYELQRWADKRAKHQGSVDGVMKDAAKQVHTACNQSYFPKASATIFLARLMQLSPTWLEAMDDLLHTADTAIDTPSHEKH